MAAPNKEPPKPTKGDSDTRSQNEKTAHPDQHKQHDHDHGKEGPNPPAADPHSGQYRGSENDSLKRDYDFDPNYNPQVPQEKVQTVGEEQTKRSEEIERMGVDNWKDSQDTRDPKDRPRQVPGVTNLDRAE